MFALTLGSVRSNLLIRGVRILTLALLRILVQPERLNKNFVNTLRNFKLLLFKFHEVLIHVCGMPLRLDINPNRIILIGIIFFDFNLIFIWSILHLWVCFYQALNLGVKLWLLLFSELFVYLFVDSLLILFFCVKNAFNLSFNRLKRLFSWLFFRLLFSLFSLAHFCLSVHLDFIALQ